MKYITVAKDKAAMIALDYDTARPDQLWEYVLTEDEHSVLFTSGLTDKLNEICDSMIDDFEDERIDNQKYLEAGLAYLNSIRNAFVNQHLIGVLINMFEKALQNNTAVYFYF